MDSLENKLKPSNWYDFADLDHGFAAVVFALVGDEVGRCSCERAVEIQHCFEVQVANRVVVGGRAGRKGADAAIDLDADETAGSEKLACKDEVRAEIVLPVKGGPGSGGIHHAETDHELGIQVE